MELFLEEGTGARWKIFWLENFLRRLWITFLFRFLDFVFGWLEFFVMEFFRAPENFLEEKIMGIDHLLGIFLGEVTGSLVENFLACDFFGTVVDNFLFRSFGFSFLVGCIFFVTEILRLPEKFSDEKSWGRIGSLEFFLGDRLRESGGRFFSLAIFLEGWGKLFLFCCPFLFLAGMKKTWQLCRKRLKNLWVFFVVSVSVVMDFIFRRREFFSVRKNKVKRFF